MSEYVALRQRTAGAVPRARIHVVPNPVTIPERVRPAAEVRASLGLERAGGWWPPRVASHPRRASWISSRPPTRSRPTSICSSSATDRSVRGWASVRAGLRTGRRVHLAGQRPDAAECVAAADVCVVPSRWEEAFCLAAAEALARGRPLVATRVGAIPELVQDGVTGLLVPPASPTALAAAVLRLLEAPALAAALGQAGRAHVAAAHGWPRAVAAMASLFAPAFGARGM